MTLAAVIAGAAAVLALVALIAWLAHVAIAAGDRAAAAEVARADTTAQLELARADVATRQRALEAMSRAADTYKELARAASAQPPLPGLAAGAHGVDELLAAIDVARAVLPAQPAGGDDRPAGDGGGLPGGAGPAPGPDAAVEPASVRDASGIADVLR